MNNVKYLIVVSLLLLGACNGEIQTGDGAEDSAVNSEISETSIFNLEHKWLNQNADSFQLAQLQGRPSVVAMIYTHCNFSCPRIVADMREIESLVPKDKLNDVNFVLISIDPENDRPDTLLRFLNENEMDPAHWILLTGEINQVEDMAAVLGFKYKKSTAMDFAHSNLITAFDANGEQIMQTEGFGSAKQEMVDRLLVVSK